jgi:LuxR family maltose regulon positive regulatory protein
MGGSLLTNPVDIPLLKTKLYVPPVRPGLVSRPRLIERLDEGLRAGNTLSLISAPAGFGKTTLLTEWVHLCGRPVAWVSLDEGDNDPTRFLAYTIAAIQTVAAGAGQAALALVDASGLTAIEPVLTALINAMADLRPGLVLVFDDYHLIETQEVHDALAFLLDHLPLQLHLVIATRADPPMPLARLRARGRLTELRYEDLRFLPHEVTAFLNDMMNLDLAPEEVDALDARTEGWIAGLQLAALSLRGRADVQDFITAFSSSHHYVLEYLTEETLDRLPEGVERFLLQTSILDRLCGSLCDAVTGKSDGESLLALLFRDNLFLVPLDEERLWYRYHPLFADLLLKRLMKGTTAEEVSELRRRASLWHEDHGSLDEAVNYALQARDFERVVRLVDGAASAGRLESRLSTMLRWLDAVPERLLLLRPRLCIYQAWALVINEQLDRAAQMLRESTQALASLPPSAESDALRERLAALLTVVDMMASSLAAAYSGEDLDQVFQVALAVRDRALAIGNVFLAAHAVNGLAMGRFHQGRLIEAGGYYHELVDLGHEGSGSQLPLAAVGHIGLAAICLERNQLEAAEQHLSEGMRLGRYRIGTNTLVAAAIARSRLRGYAGDSEGALAALDEVERIRRVKESPPAVHRLTRQRLWLHLCAEELDQADRLAQRLGEGLGPEKFGGTRPVVFQEAQQILLARLCLRRGETARALALLDELEGTAQTGKRSGRLLEIHLLQALAHQVQGRISDALTCLERSLQLAEPEGYVRIYLDEGEPAAALLRAFGRSSSAPSHLCHFANSLLEAFGAATPPGVDEVVPAARPALVEPLTRRERQVLRRLVAGLSAPEIAQELVVAPSTVRSHLKRIYGKLEVHGRHEAVDRARELELV